MTSFPSLSRPAAGDVPARSPSGTGPRGLLIAAAVSGLAGLLIVVAGTFLPWLTSGGVQRNSYAVLGIVRRLALVDGGPLATAISLWPMLGSVAMVPVVAGILQWWRTAAIATLLFGLLTGIGAACVLAVAGGHQAAGISLSSTGPAVTIAGAALALVGAVLVLVARRRPTPPPMMTPPPTATPPWRNQQVSGEPTDGPLRRTANSVTYDSQPAHTARFAGTADSTAAVETERDMYR